MADFHEVRFPTSISRGSSGGPRRRTDIVTLRSGFEERNAVWADSRREYDAGLGLRHLDDLHSALEFFEARLGALYGFRWKDWVDYKSCPPNVAVSYTDQQIGTGDGAKSSFQLVKAYASGGFSYTRSIKKPVASSVVVGVNGTEVPPAGYAVDVTTGIVTLVTPPAPASVVTGGFEFDVPVRFASDAIDVSVENFLAGSVPQIKVLEVRV